MALSLWVKFLILHPLMVLILSVFITLIRLYRTDRYYHQFSVSGKLLVKSFAGQVL